KSLTGSGFISRKGGTCCQYSSRHHDSTSLANRTLSPSQRFFILAQEIMRQSHSGKHVTPVRVLWVEAHCMFKMLAGRLWLSYPDTRPTAEQPCPSHVRIDGGRTVCEFTTLIKITDHES